MQALGIDIGGSGIKGAVVNADTGELVTERLRIATPQPATPSAVARVVAELVTLHQWQGIIGCTFPAIMKNGVAFSAANVDSSWIGTDAAKLFATATGSSVTVINDADAAGIAEMTHGAGVGVKGTVILLTFGTGIGSAFFRDGVLVPNTELGHLQINGAVAEHRASDRVREENDMSWKKWGKRVSEYMRYVEFLFSPDLFIFGGGVSKRFEEFAPYLNVKTPVVPAALRNDAGIVGAAMAAVQARSEVTS